MAVGVAEILLLLALGGAVMPVSLTHSQPLLWLGGSAMRIAAPVMMWERVEHTASGPAAIVVPSRTP
jgi:hypothetical protein